MMKRYGVPAGLLMVLVALGFSIHRDSSNLSDGYSCDLRKRIVGARYMAAGQSPYFYKWKTTDPVEWCNPYESGPLMQQNVVTLPPAYLWLLQPLAAYAFPVIERTWLALQYLLLLAIAGLLLWYAQKPQQRVAVMVLTGAFLFTAGWIYNVDIGQSYMLFPALWSAAFVAGGKTNRSIQFAAVILAVSCWLRPVCGIMILPFLMTAGRLQFLKNFSVTGFLLLTQVLLSGQWNHWMDFFKSAALWNDYYAHLGTSSYSDFGNGPWPAVIEGQTDFSLTPLPDYTANLPIVCNAVLHLPIPGIFFLTALVVAIFFLCYTGYKKRSAAGDMTFHWILAFLAYYAVELLLPVPKPSYYLPELLFPLGLVVAGKWPMQKGVLVLLVSGLLLAVLPQGIVPMNFLLGEYVLVAAIVVQAMCSMSGLYTPGTFTQSAKTKS